MKSQVLHSVWCYISGEAAREIWNWSLGVKGLTWQWRGIHAILHESFHSNSAILLLASRILFWFQLFYIVQGAVEVTVHDTTVELRAGSTFFVPQGASHDGRGKGAKEDRGERW